VLIDQVRAAGHKRPTGLRPYPAVSHWNDQPIASQGVERHARATIRDVTEHNQDLPEVAAKLLWTDVTL
jgi:hypothetical protein